MGVWGNGMAPFGQINACGGNISPETKTPKEPAQPPAAVVEDSVEMIKKKRGKRPGKEKPIEKPIKKRRGRPPSKTKPVVDKF